MTSNLNETPIEIQIEVNRDEELRCPHYHQKKRGICNKLLCIGAASKEPQEFKCPNCGNKTIFQRLK